MSSPAGHDWKLITIDDWGSHRWECSNCGSFYWSKDNVSPDIEIQIINSELGIDIFDPCDIVIFKKIHEA